MKSSVTLRRIPHPYRAMLAICSDLDETPDRATYWEIARFLNTTDPTAMGSGAGLEVGNSIYFDMPPDQFAYWNTDDAGREMIRALILSGHIDCLHSYGDLAVSRAHAGRALEELQKHNCRLPVWVDHGTAPTNFGSDIMHGFGDVPGHPAYHADLTLSYGIHYVWRGRVTSLICQDVCPYPMNVWNARHPLVSARTLAKELTKRLLAHTGREQYRLHLPNRILNPITLRDGRLAGEFLRSNPHWGGVSAGDTASGLDQVLTDRNLDQLVERQGICILYTHLGKALNHSRRIGPAAVTALYRLAQRAQNRQILVTTTARLLKYLTVRDCLQFHARTVAGTLRVTIPNNLPASRDDLNGIAFEFDRTTAVEITIGKDQRLPFDIHHHGTRTIAAVPWKPLIFPRIQP